MSYRTLLRWAALPVTNRRWAAPLSAIALGFGLFVGVAIGPSAAGTLATPPLQLIEMPALADGGGGEEESAEAEEEAGPGGAEASDGLGEEEAPAFAPVVPVEEAGFEPVKEEPVEKTAAPQGEEEPAQPEEQELAGTVVHVNAAAGSYTVAEEGGVMSAVHAGKPPAPGAQVEVPIRALANGTLAEAGVRHRTGAASEAELAGIVSFVGTDPAAPAYTISNRGSSVLVHVPPDPSGALPPLPVLGAYGSAKVGIEAGVLWQRQLNAAGAPFTHADFEGIVAAVDLENGQLTISADDVRESGQDIVFSVPPQIDTSALAVGSSVLASADIGAEGALTLTGLAGDQRLKGADDEKATQGDLVPEQPKGSE